MSKDRQAAPIDADSLLPLDLEDLSVDELNTVNDGLEADQQAIRAARLKLVAVRNRKLRLEHLIPLMKSTGRDPAEMTLDQMEEIAARIKANRQETNQTRLAVPPVEARLLARSPHDRETAPAHTGRERQTIAEEDVGTLEVDSNDLPRRKSFESKLPSSLPEKNRGGEREDDT